MSVVYSLYIREPASRNLEGRISHEAQWRRLEDLHKIDALVRNLVEDLADLLPAGYTIESTKETP